MAMCVMPISLHALNMSFSRAAPSSSEYWVWTCRCVNGGLVTARDLRAERCVDTAPEVYDPAPTAADSRESLRLPH